VADREQQLRSARISVALLSDEIKSLVDASAQAQLQHAAELEKTTNRLESQVPIFLNREAVFLLFFPILSDLRAFAVAGTVPGRGSAAPTRGACIEVSSVIVAGQVGC
jgi:hypothetical protein